MRAARTMGGMSNAQFLTRAQVRELDRLAIEEYGLPGIVLMENAGGGSARRVVELALVRPEAATRRVRVAVLCGTGNNGGDGYVLARHVANAGLAVDVFASGPRERLTSDAGLFRAVVERMGIDVHDIGDAASLERARGPLDRADILVDALLGTGFDGPVRGDMARVLDLVEELRTGGVQSALRTVVALDLPSGLDCDSGAPSKGTVRADFTLTFVAPKQGFASRAAQPHLGRVEVISIGTPIALVQRVRALG